MRPYLIASLIAGPVALAAQQNPDDSGLTLEQFEARLEWQQGAVVIASGKALLQVPQNFRYLGPEQSAQVLEAWGNPPDASILGMLFPAGLSPFAPDGWAVVVTYEAEGHVKDDDAAKIDYADLLRRMQKGSEEENQKRRAAGFEPVSIVGWAEPPHYDQPSHKLYWAKELKFGESQSNTLNYNIRVLGRSGVLVLNAVAEMSELAAVRTGMQEVLGFVDFTEGNRYTDFVAGKDKVAAYGIAALVAGAAASKAGFFKLVVAGLLAAKKFVVVAVVALAVGARKWWTRRREAPTAGSAA